MNQQEEDRFAELGLVDKAMAASPEEICGFIVHNGETDQWDLLPVTNVANDKTKFFEMDQEELRSAYTNHMIVADYHSHPNGPYFPSLADRRYANLGLRHFIVTSGGVMEWEVSPATQIALEQQSHEESGNNG
jgi:proteasome lid subunit RPN8/RPN11